MSRAESIDDEWCDIEFTQIAVPPPPPQRTVEMPREQLAALVRACQRPHRRLVRR